MLDSTFELISQAASNPHMVFCFCNLLIAILLVGTSKPTSNLNEETPEVGPTYDEKEKPRRNSVSLCENVSATMAEAAEKLSPVDATMIENEERVPHEEEEEDDDDDDDDLKRRVEEFIEKINREWRAEKMKTYLFGAND